MEKIIKMKQLVEELNKASDAYYNTGNTIMSDKEFDSKLKYLEQLEKETNTILSNSPTQNVGSPVLDKLNKINHEHRPMLSLEKVHSAEEIIKFAQGQELIAMIKLDGLSIRLTYENGKLVRGETRGNGVEGSDVTEHVKQFKNIPLSIQKEGTYVVDGEAIIEDGDFESINTTLPEGVEKFKNSRNLASGTLALLDTSLVKERYLSFVLWDVIVGENDETFYDRIENARQAGFTVVPAYTTDLDIESVNDCINFVFSCSKEAMYPNDGVVFKINDVKYGETLGQTSHHFCNAVAYKAKQDEHETVLKDIEWSCGKTGQLTPVAIFDSVEIDGTEVSRASVHNISILTDLKLGIGDTITVYKANQIIPQIADNLTKSDNIEIPETCPVCGGKTKIVKENDTEVLVCTNENCQGKLLGRLSHFVSKNAINIDGMSEATLEFMINELGVKSFRDLYYIPFYKEVYTKWIGTPGFGKKSVDNLRAAIEKSRETTFDRFLYAQSIPLVGRTASKDIAKFCKGNIDTFCDMMTSGAAKKFMKIDGFGQAMYESLMNWQENHWIEFLALKSEFNFINTETNQNNTSTNLNGKTFVITGSLNHFDNRDQLKEKLESLGAKVSGSVSAKTFALICNEDAGSSKSQKAKALGVSVWTEEQLLEFIK